MKKEIFQLLKEKDVNVPVENQDEIMHNWKSILSKKEQLNQEILDNYSHALRFIPGGDKK